MFIIIAFLWALFHPYERKFAQIQIESTGLHSPCVENDTIAVKEG